MPEEASKLIDHVFRHHYGRMVAGLTRVFGPDQLDLVEDVVSEAMVRALRVWPYQGVPDRPEAWLIQVARNRALDQLRHRSMARAKEADLQRWAEANAATDRGGVAVPQEIADDSLRMIFTCCHPSLSVEARVALTLKTLCGFGTREIAAALLAKEPTVAQRLSRAKAQLQREQVVFEVPASRELEERLRSVLEVLYLMFNEGYSAHTGAELVRGDLVQEAVRLVGVLLEIPATARPEVHALLALMLLLGARLPARTDALGEPLTLAQQDRSRWSSEWTARGFFHLQRSIAGDELTAYHLEASIASLHAMAARYEDTDWARILERYDQLVRLNHSPIVQLNRAVAVAKVHGCDAGLSELDRLADEPVLSRYHLMPATRAQLLWSKGKAAEAMACLQAAIELCGTEPERQLLQRRMVACRSGEAPPRW